MPRILVLLGLLATTACTKAEPSEQVQEQVQALQLATEELKAARAAFETDGAATRESLEKVRGELAALNAGIADATKSLLDQPARSLGSDSPSSPDDASPPMSEAEADVAAAIRCASESRCTIDRGFMATMMANPASMVRQARIVPSTRDGVTLGYKLYGIRPGSIPRALGFKNGDLITEVNGNALSSIDEAMALYSKLRTETTFTLQIERKGTSRSLTIEIGDPAETSGSSAP